MCIHYIDTHNARNFLKTADCVCVCVCVCYCVFQCICDCVSVCVLVFICVNFCVHVCVCMCVDVHGYMWKLLKVLFLRCLLPCCFNHCGACVCVCVCVCVYVCVCVSGVAVQPQRWGYSGTHEVEEGFWPTGLAKSEIPRSL